MNIILAKRIYKFEEKLDNNLTIIGRASIEVVKDSFYIYGSIMDNDIVKCSFQYEWTKGGDIISKSITNAENPHVWDPIIQDFMERAYDYISHQTNEPL